MDRRIQIENGFSFKCSFVSGLQVIFFPNPRPQSRWLQLNCSIEAVSNLTNLTKSYQIQNKSIQGKKEYRPGTIHPSFFIRVKTSNFFSSQIGRADTVKVYIAKPQLDFSPTGLPCHCNFTGACRFHVGEPNQLVKKALYSYRHFAPNNYHFLDFLSGLDEVSSPFGRFLVFTLRSLLGWPLSLCFCSCSSFCESFFSYFLAFLNRIAQCKTSPPAAWAQAQTESWFPQRRQKSTSGGGRSCWQDYI